MSDLSGFSKLEILNKSRAFEALLSDATDVADDDEENADYNKHDSLLQNNVVHELRSYINALHNVYSDDKSTKYVMGSGFGVHYIHNWVKNINQRDLSLLKQLEKYLCNDFLDKIKYSKHKFHKFPVMSSKYWRKFQLQNPYLNIYLQPLIDALCGERSNSIKKHTSFDVVDFHDTISPKQLQHIWCELSNRILFILDLYLTIAPKSQNNSNNNDNIKEFTDTYATDYSDNTTTVTYDVMGKVNAFKNKHPHTHIINVCNVGCHYMADGQIVPTHYRLVTVKY